MSFVKPLVALPCSRGTWRSVSDAAGVPQPVGIKKPFAGGFCDLLGNISEWFESIDRFETGAWHIGGHAQDRIESIFTVPSREARAASVIA